MSVSLDLRAAVRDRFRGCCGYCGVSEIDVGNPLEIDHYQPRVADGANDLDNLVYTCPACNRYKSDYWPGKDAPEAVQLLNPNQDPRELHMAETISGRLVGLTPRGWFHIGRLHLNRPLLVAFRQQRQRAHLIGEALSQAQSTSTALQARIEALEGELAELRGLVAQLMGRAAEDND
jgi:hypothetical protein